VAARVEGAADSSTPSSLLYTYVEPGYFETLGIPVLVGRAFDSQALNGRVAILSESAARQIFGQSSPVGGAIRMGLIDELDHRTADLVADGPEHQIVGVAGDTRGWTFDGSDSRQIYLPLPANGVEARPFLVRTQSDPSALIARVEDMIGSIDPDIVVTAYTLEQARRQSGPYLTSSFAAAIAAVIGAFGLLLALTGIFGTVNHMVAKRTREVGIRMALGAQQRNVLGLILREICKPVVAGLGFGMVLAAALVYLLRGILYGISAVDGVNFVILATLFFIAALIAAYPPARKASRVDPMSAVRSE